MDALRWIACIPAGLAAWIFVTIAIPLIAVITMNLFPDRSDPAWWTQMIGSGLSAYAGTWTAATVAPSGRVAVGSVMTAFFAVVSTMAFMFMLSVPAEQLMSSPAWPSTR
jgi:hypothetical protein